MHEIAPTLTHAHHSHQVKESLLCHGVLHTHFTKDYIISKANLDNYNGLTDPGEHIQNIISILEPITIKNDAIYIIFPATFHGSTRSSWSLYKAHLSFQYQYSCQKEHQKALCH